MPRERELQASRYELKYLIGEGRARSIRDYIRSYLEVDPYSDPRTGSYGVHSLYLDSEDMVLCRQTLQGHKNRFKLRIRYYSEEPAAPAFLEIKRRVDKVILKDRAMVSREAAGRLLRGKRLGPEDLLRNGVRSRIGLDNFCVLRDQIGAEGRVYVSYDREAYVSPEGNALRVTFDRHVVGSEYDSRAGFSKGGVWSYAAIQGVILEIKFTQRFPDWMRNMVSVFDLEQCSMAKYVHCVDAVRAHRDFTATSLKGLRV